jgi:uncharacterized protein YdgA (DUF945 family)
MGVKKDKPTVLQPLSCYDARNKQTIFLENSMASKTRIAITTLAVVVISAVAFIPKVIGLGIHDLTINNLIALIPSEADSRLVIDESTFDSGWFSSTATVSANYTPFGAESITVNFDFTIKHGPILLTNDGLRFGIAYAEITPNIADTLPIFGTAIDLSFPDTLLELYAGFDQSLLIGITVEPLSHATNNEEFEFAGLSASFLARADQSAELLVNIGKLSVKENLDNLAFTIDGIDLISKSTRISDILAPTLATFSIPNIKISAPATLTISNILASTELRASSNANAVQLTQHIATQSIVGDSPLQSFDWQLELDEVQRQLVSDYYDLLSELQAQSGADAQAAALKINQISQELSLLVMNNPLVINNLFTANAYDGAHRAELKLRWVGLPKLDNIARLNMNEAIAALEMSLDIALDFDSIMRSPAAEQVKAYVEQGFIIIENEKVLVKATLNNSQLTLNGEDIPLDQFF